MAAPTSTSFNRFVRGNIGDVASYPAASGYQINNGDLCLLFSGNLYAAQAWGNVIAWSSGTEIQNWSGARAVFAGVSMGQYNSYSVFSGIVPVAQEGVFQYPFPLANSGTTIQPGVYVGFTQTASSGYFQPQTLMQTSGATTAIGKVEELMPVNSSGQGMATVALQSFITYGGVAN